MDAELNGKIERNAQRAVEAAEKKYGVQLDFSIASLQGLEKILARIHQVLRPTLLKRLFGKAASDETKWKASLVWGCYLGEVLRRNYGGAWERSSVNGTEVVALKDGDLETFPVNKVFKRIADGPADDVVFYAAAFKQIVDERRSKQG